MSEHDLRDFKMDTIKTISKHDCKDYGIDRIMDKREMHSILVIPKSFNRVRTIARMVRDD